MRRSINWRFLIGCVILLAVVGVSLHFAHRWQVRNQTGAYLRLADEARDADDPERELRFLERYISARPDEVDPRERHARLVAKTARGMKAVENAFFKLEDVLRRDPSRAALRRYAVEFALTPRGGVVSSDLLPAAKGHITELLKASPADGDLEERFAFCLMLEREFAQAAGWYKKAYTHKPGLIDAYIGHAELLRTNLSDPAAADQVVAEMVANNATQARAHLFHADYWKRYGNPERAAAAAETARKLTPDDPDVILATADAAAELARTAADRTTADAHRDHARAVLDQGRKLHPKTSLLYVRRAELAGTLADAKAVLGEGLTAVPNDLTLLAALFECQFRAGDLGAADTVKALETAGLPADGLAYAQAKVRMLRGDWRAAARDLEQVRSTAVNPALTREISLHLGRCYTQLGEPDRRLQAYARAVPDDRTDPAWVPATLGQAEAAAELGRLDDALRLYQTVAESNRSPGSWLQVARFRILRTVDTPDPARRDWKAAEEALGRAEKEKPDDAEVKLLRADLHVLRGQPADADKIIDDLAAKQPKEPLVWAAKASQAFRRERSPDAAVRVLEQGRRELSDPVRLRIEQARYLADPKDATVAQKLEALAAGVDAYSPAERLQLTRVLANTAEAVGATGLADRLWGQVVAARPDDLSVHLIRFERASAGTDADALDRSMAEVRRIDGESGPSTRFTRATGLLWKALKKGDRSGLAEAFDLFDGLERDRPGWYRLSVGKAQVRDAEGQPDAALGLYQQAVERGAVDPQVLRRLHALLVQKGRFSEANDVLTRLSSAAGDPAVQKLTAETSLLANDPKRALEMAAKAVPESSDSAADQIWLAQVRRAAGDKAGAEKSYRRAVALKPEDADGWYLFLELLTSSGRGAEAEGVLTEAKAKVRPESVALLTARYTVLTGRLEQAKEEFQKARLARPADPKVLLAEADFLTAVQLWPAAREAWERVIALPAASADDKRFAGQALAVCLAMDPDYAVSQRALEQLKALDADGSPDTPARRRTRAIVLSLQKDRASKLAAITLLKADRDTLAASDRFTLAQLYNQVGDRPAFRAEMTELLRTADRNPLYVAYFADWLLKQNEVREAETWVTKLDGLRPDAVWTAELKARTRVARNDPAGAKAVLQEAGRRPNPPLATLARVAEGVGLNAEAEEFLTKAVAAQRASTPEVVLELAKFYARRGRLADALSVLEPAWKTCPPASVGQACVEALTSAPAADANAVKQVAGWIDTARTGTPNAAPALLYQLALVRNMEGQYDAAIDLFRRSIPRTRPDPQALNNLAFLLSIHQGKHDEALALMELARREAGPVPNLLDTEAQIRIARGTRADLDAARVLLRDVIALAPSGVTYFHLAQLEAKSGNQAEAAAAWAEAQRRKIKPADLHPLELPAFREMESRRK
jgi:tetratricopeptide (TPR) repeat protein